MRHPTWIGFVLALALAAGCDTEGPTDPVLQPAPAGADTVTLASGLKFVDIVVGTGAQPTTGDAVAARLTTWLADGTFVGQRNLVFTLGASGTPEALNQGVPGMRVGGTRRLIVPPGPEGGQSTIVDVRITGLQAGS